MLVVGHQHQHYSGFHLFGENKNLKCYLWELPERTPDVTLVITCNVSYLLYCRRRNLWIWLANYRHSLCRSSVDMPSSSRFCICHGHLVIVFVVLPPWFRCLHLHRHHCHHGGDGNHNNTYHCHYAGGAGHHRTGVSASGDSSSSGCKYYPSHHRGTGAGCGGTDAGRAGLSLLCMVRHAAGNGRW